MDKKWFSMLELLVVMLVIGVITTVLALRLWDIGNRTSDTARILDVRSIATALIHYWMDHESYPVWDNASSLTMLIWSEYWFGWVIPKDPATKKPYSYNTLEDDNHFIVCTKLSFGSNVGNTDKDYAAIINEWDDDSESMMMTYAWVIEKLSDCGNYYCFVG